MHDAVRVVIAMVESRPSKTSTGRILANSEKDLDPEKG